MTAPAAAWSPSATCTLDDWFFRCHFRATPCSRAASASTRCGSCSASSAPGAAASAPGARWAAARSRSTARSGRIIERCATRSTSAGAPRFPESGATLADRRRHRAGRRRADLHAARAREAGFFRDVAYATTPHRARRGGMARPAMSDARSRSSRAAGPGSGPRAAAPSPPKASASPCTTAAAKPPRTPLPASSTAPSPCARTSPCRPRSRPWSRR